MNLIDANGKVLNVGTNRPLESLCWGKVMGCGSWSENLLISNK
jgi:hypothetical protein